MLKNDSLGYELLESNPFETNASSSTNASAKLFGNNNSVIRVNHRDNGFEDAGKSYVFYRSAKETSGITANTLNSTLFEVDNGGVDTYTIRPLSQATGNAIGGGDSVYATHNRKFETLYPRIDYLTITGTKLEASVKTTNVVPVDSSTTNYTSYSQSDFERTFLNEAHYFTNQKIVALGGISKQNLKKLHLLKIFGFAGISYFEQKKTAPKRGR